MILAGFISVTRSTRHRVFSLRPGLVFPGQQNEIYLSWEKKKKTDTCRRAAAWNVPRPKVVENSCYVYLDWFSSPLVILWLQFWRGWKGVYPQTSWKVPPESSVFARLELVSLGWCAGNSCPTVIPLLQAIRQWMRSGDRWLCGKVWNRAAWSNVDCWGGESQSQSVSLHCRNLKVRSSRFAPLLRLSSKNNFSANIFFLFTYAQLQISHLHVSFKKKISPVIFFFRLILSFELWVVGVEDGSRGKWGLIHWVKWNVKSSWIARPEVDQVHSFEPESTHSCTGTH